MRLDDDGTISSVSVELKDGSGTKIESFLSRGGTGRAKRERVLDEFTNNQKIDINSKNEYHKAYDDLIETLNNNKLNDFDNNFPNLINFIEDPEIREIKIMSDSYDWYLNDRDCIKFVEYKPGLKEKIMRAKEDLELELKKVPLNKEELIKVKEKVKKSFNEYEKDKDGKEILTEEGLILGMIRMIRNFKVLISNFRGWYEEKHNNEDKNKSELLQNGLIKIMNCLDRKDLDGIDKVLEEIKFNDLFDESNLRLRPINAGDGGGGLGTRANKELKDGTRPVN